jgi:putative membrane protein
MNTGEFDDPRVPLASERTLLAWIRTSLAMMGFGLAVVRFGLLPESLEPASAGNPSVESPDLSLWFGATLVVLAAVTALLAAFQHLVFLHRLASDKPYRPGSLSLGVIVAGGIALIGAVTAGYLLLSARS